MTKKIIQTKNAPQPIGAYSQAVAHGNSVYLSGQIAINPKSGEMVMGSFQDEIVQVFDNLKAVAEAAGGSLDNVLKFTIYLTNLNNFPQVNDHMITILKSPFPARATVGVAALPKGANVEIDAVLALQK